jgi:hypothetical protein
MWKRCGKYVENEAQNLWLPLATLVLDTVVSISDKFRYIVLGKLQYFTNLN